METIDIAFSRSYPPTVTSPAVVTAWRAVAMEILERTRPSQLVHARTKEPARWSELQIGMVQARIPLMIAFPQGYTPELKSASNYLFVTYRSFHENGVAALTEVRMMDNEPLRARGDLVTRGLSIYQLQREGGSGGFYGNIGVLSENGGQRQAASAYAQTRDILPLFAMILSGVVVQEQERNVHAFVFPLENVR